MGHAGNSWRERLSAGRHPFQLHLSGFAAGAMAQAVLSHQVPPLETKLRLCAEFEPLGN